MPILSFQGKTVLFIHVPKTGGSAIEKHFAVHGQVSFDRKVERDIGMRCIPRHFHGALLESLFDAALFDYVFMVVRDPVARTLSDFRYYIRRKRRLGNPPNFSAWLRYRFFRASRNPYYMDNHFRPQSEFECFGARIHRMEDGLSACIAEMNAKLGTEVPEDLPLVNQSPNLDVPLTDADRAFIYRRYRDDYGRFGYQKP